MSIKTLSADSEILKKNLLYSSLTEFYSGIPEEDMERFLDIITGKSKISLRIIDWFVTNYSKKKNIVYYINQGNGSGSTAGTSATGKKGSNKRKRLSPKARYQENAPDKVNNSTVQFFVYLRYRSQLTSYHKIKFDPFCRNDRIVNWGPNGDITTTLAQLNFFKWAIENRVLDYIKAHLKEIEIDMNTNIRPGKEKKKGSGKKKTVKASKTGGGTGASGGAENELTSVNIDNPGTATTTPPGSASVSKKKRRELSTNATKTINKHKFTVVLDFD
jgi:hypothetical protein